MQGIDLDLPHRQLIVFCGVSGSGKSSLAFDTIYAEGQRRYIESFSAYTRQFLERLEKPAAQRIDGISPAIAVATSNSARSSRATVGTSTEAYDYLRLLLARVGRVYCRQCGREVLRHAPQSVAAELARLPAGTRYMVAFPWPHPASVAPADLAARIVEEGFVRAIVGSQVVELADLATQAATAESAAAQPLLAESTDETSVAVEQEGDDDSRNAKAGSAADWHVIVDRLAVGSSAEERMRDSLETAFDKGRGRAVLYVEEVAAAADLGGAGIEIDGRAWRHVKRNTRLVCDDCGLEYPQPDPRLFSFNSPLGACPECEGFGNVVDIDMDLVVPDKQKSICEGAIAPWNTPAYAHERDELVALAKDYGLPVDVPFAELNDEQRRLIVEGVPEREFGGLRGFFAWLERRKYKMHVRVFLSRWRSYRLCPACGGARLRPEALAVRIGGKNIAEICACRSTRPSRSSGNWPFRTGSARSAARCSNRCRPGSRSCAPWDWVT